MHARVELKIDVEAHTVKEAGNLPEFGAYSLITVAQDPVYIHKLCIANKRESREDRSQRRKEN